MRTGAWIAGLALAAALAMGPQAAFAMDGIGHGGGGTGGGPTTGSGEVYSTLGTILQDAGRFVRDAVIERLDGSDGDRDPGAAVWGHGYGATQDADAQGATAGFGSDTNGALGGLDLTTSGGWRWGGVVGSSGASFGVDARQSHGDADGRQAGLYGGGPLGPWIVAVGADWTRNDVRLRRTDPGGAYAAKGSVDATEVFVRAGYRTRWLGAEAQPYLLAAWTRLNADSFTETGGPVPLTARGGSRDGALTDLGLEAAWERGAWRPFVDLAWRRRYGNLDPAVDLASGGSSLGSTAGTPLARDAGVARAGFDLALGRRAGLRLSYEGTFSRHDQAQTLAATLAWRF